ncbi:MAG: hypothetical protein KME38_24060 [Spirirestis rafaelensis WJT71-NPBG6]|jgi:hypothetical protein|nr:hypothetical protein [Spirirestis rafaelensis WJT71-NPBG6]
MIENTPSWERLESESQKQWDAFRLYRDMGQNRSIARVLVELGLAPSSQRMLERFSSKNNWVQRCREYDDYCDRRNRAELEATKREEYQTKLEKYWSDKEQLARFDLNLAIQARQVIQRHLNFYWQNQEEVIPIGQIAALIRAITALTESADRSLISIFERETSGHRTEGESILIDSEDPIELVKEHQRLLDQLASLL